MARGVLLMPYPFISLPSGPFAKFGNSPVAKAFNSALAEFDIALLCRHFAASI